MAILAVAVNHAYTSILEYLVLAILEYSKKAFLGASVPYTIESAVIALEVGIETRKVPLCLSNWTP